MIINQICTINKRRNKKIIKIKFAVNIKVELKIDNTHMSIDDMSIDVIVE